MENDKVREEDKKGVDEVANQMLAHTNNASAPSISSDNDFQFIEKLANQLENMQKIGEVFIKGGLCPIKNVNDFVVAATNGMQLGLPLTTAVNNIFVVNSKPAIATHLMRAMLLKAGIVYEKIYDYEPMYAYYEAVKGEGEELVAKKVTIPDSKNPGKVIEAPIQRGIGTIDKIKDLGFFIGRNEVDRITQYVFKRKLRQADGSYQEVKAVSNFKMSDARIAGLLEKDNYRNYPARMLDARAFAIGGREIASDIIFGMYTIAELADSSDVPYTMNNSFEEEIQDATVVE